MEAKEYKAAEAHFRRCLATEKVIKTIPGHEIIELKLELASVCQASGNASAQQAIFLELLQLELPKLQEFHLQHSLAMAYLGNGELDLARTHAETAMRGRRKILGRRHECYYETLTLLVDICIADNNVDDAEVYNHLLPRNCHQEATLSLAALSRDNVAQEASESRKESLSTNVDQPADLVSIKLLAENGYDIDNKEIYFEALKWTFGHSDRRDVARLLLERGTDIKGKDILGNEMLHYAAFWGFKDIASDLIVRGANVHAKTNLGNTPLHKARGVATTSMLLDAGANIESINLSGATPLISSASHGNDDKLQLLIFRGANVHAKTIRGNTSLHVARSVATTGILLTAGANIKSINNSGATPLMITASYGEDDKLQLLISRGARVDATDGQGSTALMYASGADRLQTVLLLIDNGANIQAKDSGGYAVKSYVKKSGSNSKEILRLLDSRRPKGKRSFFQIRSWKPKT
jgi:ankyrin repeat protein